MCGIGFGFEGHVAPVAVELPHQTWVCGESFRSG